VTGNEADEGSGDRRLTSGKMIAVLTIVESRTSRPLFRSPLDPFTIRDFVSVSFPFALALQLHLA